jgi:hypothetical protein
LTGHTKCNRRASEVPSPAECTVARTLAEGSTTAEARGNAIVTLVTMVGAMTLARAVPNGAIADEILDSTRQALQQ